MNDYEQFEAFFDKMGIEYSEWKNLTDMRHGEEPQTSLFMLTVSQAIFCFDKDRKYIGVVSDEIGHFEPRRM